MRHARLSTFPAKSRLAMGVVVPLMWLIPTTLIRADPITVMSIDPRATYLRTNNDGGALGAVRIELSDYGVASGHKLRLERRGDFRPASIFSDSSRGQLGLFSASDTLLASNLLNRVPDAIDAGPDTITPNTHWGGLATDIPEDFQITNTIVAVPPGATYLFVGAGDSLFGDNTDPDGDFELAISFAVLGDMDGNGVLDAFDVDDFELALADREAYIEIHPGLDPDLLGDIDGTGSLDAFDVTPYEVLLAGGPINVPEPTTGMLSLLGLMGCIASRRTRREQ